MAKTNINITEATRTKAASPSGKTASFTADATKGLLDTLLTPAALATMALGAFGVLGSQSLFRMVAFAGIGSMGVVFLAIAAGTPQATSAALYYIVHSTLATAALFLLADMIMPDHAENTFAPPQGKPSGLIAALFLAAAIAMAGMPPLSGFVAKLLVMDALRDQAVVMWSAILLSSLITLLGFARAGSRLFWTPGAPEPFAPQRENLAATAPVMALLAAIAGLTVLAGPVTTWLDVAAAALHSPARYIAVNALQGVP